MKQILTFLLPKLKENYLDNCLVLQRFMTWCKSRPITPVFSSRVTKKTNIFGINSRTFMFVKFFNRNDANPIISLRFYMRLTIFKFPANNLDSKFRQDIKCVKNYFQSFFSNENCSGFPGRIFPFRSMHFQAQSKFTHVMFEALGNSVFYTWFKITVKRFFYKKNFLFRNFHICFAPFKLKAIKINWKRHIREHPSQIWYIFRIVLKNLFSGGGRSLGNGCRYAKFI